MRTYWAAIGLIVAIVLILLAYEFCPRGTPGAAPGDREGLWTPEEGANACPGAILPRCREMRARNPAMWRARGYRGLGDCLRDPRNTPGGCQPKNLGLYCRDLARLEAQDPGSAWRGDPGACARDPNVRANPLRRRDWECARVAETPAEYAACLDSHLARDPHA